MLNSRFFIATCLIMLTTLSGAAIAQDRFYVIGTLGKTNADSAIGFESDINDDGDSYKFGAGYALNQNFSVVAAYQFANNLDVETACPPDFACVALVVPLATKADLAIWSLSVVGSIPLTDRFDVYGKAGIGRWKRSFDGISSAFNTSGEDLLYGGGLRWSGGDDWKLSLEYENVEIGVDTVGIGVSFYF
jgi:hypothetical protein